MLRKPAITFLPEGLLQLSWRFADQPHLTFTYELNFETGTIEWFFRDAECGVVAGGEKWSPLPYNYLFQNFEEP